MVLLLLAAVAKPLESFSLVSKFTCVRNADVTLQCLFDQSGNTLFFRNVFICQVSYDHRSFYLSRLFLLQEEKWENGCRYLPKRLDDITFLCLSLPIAHYFVSA